ncbi:hypothetical protein ANCCAN_16723 [Ancylostoma caninum]|uniref:Uncharacterized protein n=1 Tax=Ancylostoma caninum TaxID=29170 RepID=A0A368G2W5_ANCCA|nr:hypothetical protein ANCCAN_16723 [Ancylostoma caninum]
MIVEGKTVVDVSEDVVVEVEVVVDVVEGMVVDVRIVVEGVEDVIVDVMVAAIVIDSVVDVLSSGNARNMLHPIMSCMEQLMLCHLPSFLI